MNALEIAQALSETALLMELNGESSFKVRAFQNAARIVESVDEPLESFVARCRAGEVNGIGGQLCDALERMFERGHLPLLDELKKQFPPGLLEIFRLPGLGPKKIKQLYEELKISSVEELHAACSAKQLSALKGFGAKTEDKVLRGIEQYWEYTSKALFQRAKDECELFGAALVESGAVLHATTVGELSRGLPIISSAEILVVTTAPHTLFALIDSLDDVASAEKTTDESINVLKKNGFCIRVYHCAPEDLVHQQLLRCGSAEYCAAFKKRIESGSAVRSNEQEIFHALKLAYVPTLRREYPEILDTAAQLFAAGKDFSPALNLEDLKGVLHAHSTYSDGKIPSRKWHNP